MDLKESDIFIYIYCKSYHDRVIVVIFLISKFYFLQLKKSTFLPVKATAVPFEHL
jgi:hypothetical protein